MKEVVNLIQQLDTKITSGFEGVYAQFADIRAELAKVREEMHTLNAETRMDLGTLIEEQRHNVELVAEQFLDIRRQLGHTALRDEVEREFADVKAMIKDLDQRLRAIEESN